MQLLSFNINFFCLFVSLPVQQIEPGREVFLWFVFVLLCLYYTVTVAPEGFTEKGLGEAGLKVIALKDI